MLLLTHEQPVRARVPLPRTLTVVVDDRRWFSIYEGERFVTQLGWDEFLGAIAVITHLTLSQQDPPFPPYARLQHVDELLHATGFHELCKRAEPPESPVLYRPSFSELVESAREQARKAEREIQIRANAWRVLNNLPLEDEEIPF